MKKNVPIIQGKNDLNKNKILDAINSYLSAVNSGNGDKHLYIKIAFSYYELENYNDSIKYCDLALEKDPNLEQAYDIKGRCYYLKNEISEAVRYLQMAFKLNSDNLECLYRICLIKYTNKTPKYKQYLSNIISYLHNISKVNLFNLGYVFYEAQILRLLQDFEEAYNVFEKFIKKCGNNKINNKFLSIAKKFNEEYLIQKSKNINTQDIQKSNDLPNKKNIKPKIQKNKSPLKKTKDIRSREDNKPISSFYGTHKYKGPSIFSNTTLELHPFRK